PMMVEELYPAPRYNFVKCDGFRAVTAGRRKAARPARKIDCHIPLTPPGFCLHNDRKCCVVHVRNPVMSTIHANTEIRRSRRLTAGDNDKDRGDSGSKSETGTITRAKPKTKRPSLYRVLLLNDDYTPMEFVVLVLQDVFNKTREDAMRIMLHVH